MKHLAELYTSQVLLWSVHCVRNIELPFCHLDTEDKQCSQKPQGNLWIKARMA